MNKFGAAVFGLPAVVMICLIVAAHLGYDLAPGLLHAAPTAPTAPSAASAASGIWATWHPARDFADLARQIVHQIVPTTREVHHLMDFALVVGLVIVVLTILQEYGSAAKAREAKAREEKDSEAARRKQNETDLTGDGTDTF